MGWAAGLLLLATAPEVVVVCSGTPDEIARLASEVTLARLLPDTDGRCGEDRGEVTRLHFDGAPSGKVVVVLDDPTLGARTRVVPWAHTPRGALRDAVEARAPAGLAVLIEGLISEGRAEAELVAARPRTATATVAPPVSTAPSAALERRPLTADDTATADAARVGRDVPLSVAIQGGGRYRAPGAWATSWAVVAQAGPLFARVGFEPDGVFVLDDRALALSCWTAGLGGELARSVWRARAAVELTVHELEEVTASGRVESVTTADLTLVVGGAVELASWGPLSLEVSVEGMWAPGARELRVPAGTRAPLSDLGLRTFFAARAGL